MIRTTNHAKHNNKFHNPWKLKAMCTALDNILALAHKVLIQHCIPLPWVEVLGPLPKVPEPMVFGWHGEQELVRSISPVSKVTVVLMVNFKT